MQSKKNPGYARVFMPSMDSFGHHYFFQAKMAVRVNTDSRSILTLDLEGRSSRSFKLLLVAVRRVTAANNNQRHHQNAYNAKQLFHKEPPHQTLESYS